jgi:hypothetical protein
MKPSQAEFLLRLAENTNDAGEEIITEMRRMGMEHARRLLEEKELLERAMDLNRQDLARFGQYLPQTNLGNQARLADTASRDHQRAAIKKVESNAS